MLERIELSAKEIKRLEILQQVASRKLRQVEAARVVGLSVRQVRRLLRAYAADGARGLVSRRRGRPSNRRIAETVKAAVLARLRERYADFGPTLAREYLREDGYTLSKETLRAWMMAAGLWQAAPVRRRQLHPPRPRRPRFGELLQVDGSLHDWLEGRGPRCALIAFIDDATSRVQYARFVPVECTQAYLDALQVYVQTHGRPAALYSDRHSIFTKPNPEIDTPTQFQRALQQLDIAGIQALSPQAKGRVERLFQTLQDRLVKALRLAEISDLAAANAALPELLAAHNARFAVAPANAENAHRDYAGSAAVLARICAVQVSRKLTKDLVLSYQKQRYLIQTAGAPRYALRGATITVVAYANGHIELLHGQAVLPFKVFGEPRPVSPPADDKTLNTRVDTVLKQQRWSWSAKSRPAPDHPWRRYPTP